jgi:hypothetical protein
MRLRRSSESCPFRDGLFFVLSLAVAVAGLAACGRGGDPARAEPSPVSRRTTVTRGMTMAEVVEAWGEPDVKVREGEAERWSYWVRDRRRQVVAKAYVVFDDEKKVAEIVTRPDANPPPPPRDGTRAT